MIGCGGNEESNKEEVKTPEKVEETPAPEKKNPKILVAYFSRTGENYQVGMIAKGNTHIMADIIAKEIGADEFEIKTEKKYPEGYHECTEVAKVELEKNERPALSTKVADMSKYDTIFLGYPIWWSDLPMAVYTFLESYDFNGKTIIPFCTSAGNYMTGKEVNIPQYAKGSTVKEGLGLEGKLCQENREKVKEDVKTWLKGLGY